jgi:AraC family transcriptional regulator
VRGDVLPGGTVAYTLHSGPYEELRGAYAAIESWMEEQGLTAAGAPWESYITDPTEHPNPADWKTEVFWPVR